MNQLSDLDRLLKNKPVLLGCGIDSASPAVAEMAGMLGYDVVWADLEHASIDHRVSEEFCRGAKAGGAMPMLRIPDTNRCHVLHALEAGARFVVVPMVETPEQAREIVAHGKFSPLGNRGVNGSSRGIEYGIGDKLENMRLADKNTYLFVQIETVEAVNRCEEIIAVGGITGGLVGPADLSVSLGKPLAFDDPDVVASFRKAVRTIRAKGKISAAVVPHPALMQVSIEEEVQIMICAGETSSLREYLQQKLRNVASMLSQGKNSNGVGGRTSKNDL
jgi:4-hydroxy-2-oxoheptanedioate aldolase